MLPMKRAKLIMHLPPMVSPKELLSESIQSSFHHVLGGQVVATRCTEYTDEPRQNVVKFLGIPIVHMSKQPDIMIKVNNPHCQDFS